MSTIKLTICCLLALIITLPACKPDSHDQTITAELQLLIPADENPEEWKDLSYEVHEGKVFITIPGWMAEDAQPLEDTIKSANHVTSVDVEIDGDAEKTPALLVVSQSEGGAWTLSGGMPDQAFVTQILAISQSILQTDALNPEFRIAREFAEPTWLPRYDQALRRLGGELENLEARFEADTVTLKGTCLNPAYCSGLTTEFEAMGLTLDSNFDSYSSLTVDSQPTGIALSGIVNSELDRTALFDCLFETDAPPESATVVLENEDDIQLSSSLFGNWCTVLRGLRPPLTNFTATFAGPRIQVVGEVQTIEEFNDIVGRFPSTESFSVQVRVPVADAISSLNATCNRSRWAVTGRVQSADTAAAIERELRANSRGRRATVDVETGDGAGEDAKVLEAIRFLPMLCSAAPDGVLRLSGKQLTLFGTADDLASIQPIREAAQESQRLEIRVRIRAFEDAGLREVQRQIDAILRDAPITFEPHGVAFDNAGSAAMSRINEVLLANRDVRFRLFVHSDGPGSARFHEKLSQERASAIMDAVYHADANDHRIQTYAAGNEYPIADTTTDEGEAENTRVELLVAGRLD